MINQIYHASDEVKPRSMHSVHLMIDEELGELARAINRPGRCDEPAFNELCDLIICLADMMWLCDSYDAITRYSDERYSNELGKWFKRAYPRDEYLAFQDLKRTVNLIDLDRDTSHVFQRCHDAMTVCMSMLRTFEPGLSYEDLSTLARVIIARKCAKWVGLTA